MRLNFCDYHILAVLEAFETSKLPLDLLLSRYFKAHKALGSKDRRTIGAALYGMTRYQSLLNFLNVGKLEAYNKLFTYLDDQSIPEPLRLGIPEFLYNRFLQIFGREQGVKLCRILNQEAPVTIRANPLKTTREALQKLLPLETTFCAIHGLQLKKREPLFALPEFKAGLFEVQDAGSQLVAELIDTKPGDHVLDYCSGSGGKTLAFAHKMQGKGQIYLYDNRPQALLEARKRLKRAGVQNAQFVLPKQKVDWLLTDVPCSGTGTLRRNPDAKWKIDQDLVNRLALLQREIVAEALEHLSPKGSFVYATCSILPEENEKQIEYFLQTHGLILIKTLSILPEENGADGFFAAVMKKQPLI